MDTVVYRSENGGVLTVGSRPPFVLTAVDGLYPSAEYDFTTVKSTGQQGETVVAGSFAPRELTLAFTVIGESRAALTARVASVAAVLTPTLPGTLTLDTPLGARRLDVRPAATPAVSLKSELVAAVTARFVAFSPLFTDAEERRAEMAAYLGGLTFPVEIGAGWSPGTRVSSRMVNVRNPGVVPCGLRAVLRAAGTVRDPYLLHAGTGARLTVCRDLAAGDRLEIVSTAERRHVDAVLGGERSGAMGFVDLDSDFPVLGVGDNLLVCGAAAFEQNLLVSIYYRPQYAL